MTFDAFAFNHKKTQASLKGDVSISYELDADEKIAEFRLGAKDSTLKELLVETWPELRKLNLHTSRHGNCQTGYFYDIKSRNRGNMGALKWSFQMDNNDLDNSSKESKEKSLKKVEKAYSEAGFYQNLIPGSMLGVPKDQPEVVVTVNKQRSGCALPNVGDIASNRAEFDKKYWTNCEFHYEESRTAKILSFSSTSVTAMKGQKFELEIQMPENTEISENAYILINNANCPILSVTSANSSNTVIAEFGDVSVGTHRILFNEPSIGIAISDHEVTAKAVISSYDPLIGSEYGGTKVTVFGSGFSFDHVVKVFDDPQDCVPLAGHVTYNKMICVTNGVSGVSNRKKRAASGTPLVSEISPAKISILGGDLMTIKGSNFGSENQENRVDVQGLASLEERACETDPRSIQRGCLGFRTEKSGEFNIVSWSDSEIIVESNMLDIGEYEMQLDINGVGFSNKVNFEMALEIQGVNPKRTSLAGGKMVTIEGFGFANSQHTPTGLLNAEKRVEVFAGQTRCHVRKVSATEIECETGHDFPETKVISIGENFENVTIKAGSAIRWEWAFTVNGQKPKIQFQDVSAFGEAEGDIKWMSEPETADSGNFVKTFIDEGIFIYSTGYVDDQFSVHLNGMVTVTRATERAQELTILLADSFSDRQWGEVNEIWEHKATHVAGPGRKRRETSCTFNKKNQENPVQNPPANHYLIYSFADTPIVESFEIIKNSETNETNNSPAMEVIVTSRGGITATGDCNSEVTLSAAFRRGPEILPQYFFTKSDGNQKIEGKYQLQNEGTMDIRDTYEFNLNLKDLGNAYFNNYKGDQRFQIKPSGKITNREKMSSLGNVGISITGLGFLSSSADSAVFLKPSNSEYENLRPYACEVISLTYDSIECHLPRVYGVVNDKNSLSWDWEVLLELTPNGDDLTQIAKMYPLGAIVKSSVASTPIVNSAEPMTFDADSGSKVKFSGENFTPGSSPVVKIGEVELENCLASSDVSFECDIPNLSAGEYDVSAHSDSGEFKFSNIGKFNAGLSVSAVTPLTGGRFGGQILTITGYGLSEDTTVSVVKNGVNLCSPCIITVFDETKILLKTPAAPEDGSAMVLINHEYIASMKFSYNFEYSSGSLGTFSLKSGSLSDLDGEEAITLSKTASLSCNNLEIELTLAKNPCSAGAHNCHSAATCTPGLDT